MNNILNLEDKKYISSRRVHELYGYSSDYIGQLCRAGKVECKMVGRLWYVTEESIVNYKLGLEKGETVSAEKKRQYKVENIKITKEVMGDVPDVPVVTNEVKAAIFNNPQVDGKEEDKVDEQWNKINVRSVEEVNTDENLLLKNSKAFRVAKILEHEELRTSKLSAKKLLTTFLTAICIMSIGYSVLLKYPQAQSFAVKIGHKIVDTVQDGYEMSLAHVDSILNSSSQTINTVGQNISKIKNNISSSVVVATDDLSSGTASVFSTVGEGVNSLGMSIRKVARDFLGIKDTVIVSEPFSSRKEYQTLTMASSSTNTTIIKRVIEKPTYVSSGVSQNYVDSKISSLQSIISFLANHESRQTDAIYNSIGNSVSNTQTSIANSFITDIANAISGGSSNFFGSALTISATSTLGSLIVSNNATVLGTLTVGSLVSGGQTIGGDFSVTGTTTLGTLNGLLFGTNGIVSAISTSSLAINTSNLIEGSNLFYTDARASTTARLALSSSATGLDYDSANGVFSLNSLYNIPLIASTTEWGNKLSSQWTTNGSNIYYNGGNVGIGTTSPYAKLSVAGRGVFDQDIRADYFTATSTTATSIINGLLNVVGKTTLGYASTTQIGSTGSAYFATGGSGSIRVDNNFSANTSGTISWGVDVDTNDRTGILSWDTGKVIIGSPTTMDLSFVTSFSSEKMRILQSNGNVGIGSSTPAEKLSVNGNQYLTGSLRLGTYAQNSIVIEGDSISSAGNSARWPYYIASSSPTLKFYNVTNYSNSGDTTATMLSEYATQGHVSRPSSPGDKAYFMIYAGINDVSGTDPNVSYSNLKTIWANAKSDGYIVVAFTIWSDTLISGAGEANRVALNKLILSDQSLYDYVVRPDLVLDPRVNSAFFSDDVHTNVAGAKLFATILQKTLDVRPYSLYAANGTTTTPTVFNMQLNQTGGNVMIGTSTGSGKFTVWGNDTTSLMTSFVNSASTTLMSILNSGNVGIGTTNPLAKLHVGSGTINNSVDAQVLISRNVDDSISGNGHAFSDSSNLTRSGIVGYNSYDARINISGTNDFDHYVSFQANPTYSSSGTITNLYGLYTVPTITAGSVLNNYGLYVTRASVSGGGAIGNDYGLYINAPITGTSTNYAIYTYGVATSSFGGPVMSSGVVRSTSNLFVGAATLFPTKNIEVHTAGGSEATLRLYQNGQNYWDISSPANSTRLSVGDIGGEKLSILATSGNVGIGTTTPAAKLDVRKDTGGTFDNTTIAAMFGDATGGQFDSTYIIGNTINSTYGYDGNSALWLNYRGYNAGITQFRDLNVGDGKGNTVAFFDGSSGNVGIGTTSPRDQLEVHSTGFGGSIRLVADNYNSAGFSLRPYAGSVFGFSIYNNNTSVESFSIINNGNVGIGTTAPATKLNLSGAGTYTFASNGLSFEDGDSGFFESSDDQITNVINGVSMAIFRSTKIQQAGGGSWGLMHEAPSATNPSIVPNENYEGTGLGSAGANILSLISNGTNVMNVTAGNVGIGTTSPSAKLHVSGTMRNDTFGAGSLVTDASGNITVSSDERLKNIQGNFNRGLTDILSINPILYKWKDTTGFDTENTYAGFSAQNVKLSIPEAVGEDARGMLTLSDRPILASLVNAIKELNTTVNTRATSTNTVSTTTIIQTIEGPEIDMALIASSTGDTLASSTTFIDRIAIAIKNMISSTGDWVIAKITATTGYFTNLFADKVTTKELCIEDVCVTKSELQALLVNMHASTTPIVATSTQEIPISATSTPAIPPVVTDPTSGNVGIGTSTPPIIVVPTVATTTTSTTTVTIDIATSTPSVVVDSPTVPPEVIVETPPVTLPTSIEVPVVPPIDTPTITP